MVEHVNASISNIEFYLPSVDYSNKNLTSKTKDEIYLMVLIHSVFILSGVILAVMDYVASKTVSHYKKTE